MQIIRKLLKIIVIILGLFVGLILCNQYVFCPVYIKQKPQVFSGKNWYNPYANLQDSNWQKANFHAHCRAWGGITHGVGNASNLHRIYDSLGYGIHSVSNYFSIDTHLQYNPKYISAYEHGTSINRTHQLVLGSKKVNWLDYLLPHNFSNKQHILNSLRADTSDVVIINHPLLDNAYDSLDFAFLQNYNCIEVLNPQEYSPQLWDAALSNGKPIFIVANDDLHDPSFTYNLANLYTCLPAFASNKNQILQCLKTGFTYAIESNHKDMTYPKLQFANITNNIYNVQINTLADSILFIGQNGKILTVLRNANNANYTLQEGDTYVRVKIILPNQQKMYLNPIFKYNNLAFNTTKGKINYPLTILKYLAALLFASLIIIYKKNKKNKKTVI